MQDMQLIIVVVLLFGCLTATAISAADDVASFGALASVQSNGKWSTFQNLFPMLNNQSRPSNTLKPLRDSLSAIRDVLDIFPFCFPINATDVWRKLRADVNDGYTILGDFIDLHDVHYTSHVEEKQLGHVLEWKDSFETNCEKYGYQQFFESPDISTFYYRDSSEYSIMYWGNSTFEPQSNASGIANIAQLVRAQLEHQITRYSTLISFSNLTTVANANYMHDYKKQLRAILQVVSWYPAVLNASFSNYTSQLMNTSQQCYDVLNRTHTIIVPYLYYLQHGSAADLAFAEIQVDKAYYEMVEFLEANAWLDWLQLFDSVLI